MESNVSCALFMYSSTFIEKKEVHFSCIIISDLCGTNTEFNLYEAVLGDMLRYVKTDDKVVVLN